MDDHHQEVNRPERVGELLPNAVESVATAADIAIGFVALDTQRNGIHTESHSEITAQRPPNRHARNASIGESTTALSIYLNEIGKFDLLTAEQERELARKIEAGREVTSKFTAQQINHTTELVRTLQQGAQAKTTFINANLRLVVSIAKRYPLPTGIELLDVIQEGNLGLEHAVDKYDWRRGFKFSTYATYWIKQAIGRSFNQKGSLIRLPGGKAGSLRSARKFAESSDADLDATNEGYFRLTTPVSLNQSVGDSTTELGDMIPSDSEFNPEEMLLKTADVDFLHSLLSNVDRRARYIIEQHYGLETGKTRSFKDIGKELGVTSEAVRRHMYRAIAAMRAEAAELQTD